MGWKEVVLAWVLLGAATSAARATTPPQQPESGPGGAEYAIGAADVKKEAYGAGAQQAFVFRPASGFAGPRPLVVFGHAVNAYNPKLYGAWIDHLVRRGAIVVFPRYQLDARTQRNELIGHAAAGVSLALEKLNGEFDATKVAYVGHAAGGNIVANLAANPNMPKAKLLFAVMPGNSWGNRYQAITLKELAALPAEMIIVTMFGETDNVARDTDARKILRESVQVPATHKLLVRLPTDTHGSPTLIATHFTPLAKHDDYDMSNIPVVDAPPPAPVVNPRARGRAAAPVKAAPAPGPQPEEFGGAAVDAADWFGFWKAFDIAMPVAFAGEDASPIKRHPQFTSMGLWSDGWPVKRLSYESPREPQAPAQPVKPAPVAAPAQTKRVR